MRHQPHAVRPQESWRAADMHAGHRAELMTTTTRGKSAWRREKLKAKRGERMTGPALEAQAVVGGVCGTMQPPLLQQQCLPLRAASGAVCASEQRDSCAHSGQQRQQRTGCHGCCAVSRRGWGRLRLALILVFILVLILALILLLGLSRRRRRSGGLSTGGLCRGLLRRLGGRCSLRRRRLRRRRVNNSGGRRRRGRRRGTASRVGQAATGARWLACRCDAGSRQLECRRTRQSRMTAVVWRWWAAGRAGNQVVCLCRATAVGRTRCRAAGTYEGGLGGEGVPETMSGFGQLLGSLQRGGQGGGHTARQSCRQVGRQAARHRAWVARPLGLPRQPLSLVALW